MNVMDFVTVEDRPGDVTWFAVDPATMYPAMIDYIATVLAENRGVGQHLATHLAAARRLPAGALELALQPREGLSKKDRETRTEALEVARRWFTAQLHAAIGNEPMGVHILKNDDWRL